MMMMMRMMKVTNIYKHEKMILVLNVLLKTCTLYYICDEADDGMI